MLRFPIRRPVNQAIEEKIRKIRRFNPVASAISRAFDAKGFDSGCSKAFASYYFKRNANLDGTVHDETPNRHSNRPELTNQATTFNGTNQSFESGVKTDSGLTATSYGCWFKSTATSDELLTQYDTVGDNRSFRLNLESSGEIGVVISSDGTFDNPAIKRIETDDSFNDGEWHHVIVTWSAASDTCLIYVDGLSVATTATSDATIASIFDGSNEIMLGARSNGGSPAGVLDGDMQLPAIWYSELTAAQVRDLYLGEFDNVPTPDKAWYLVGPKAWDLTGNGNHIDGTNSPTLSEDKDNPTFPYDFNHAGWSLGNKGRFKRTLINNESVTFEVQTTDTSFNFLNASDGNFAGLVFAGSSGGLGSVRDITIDGVLFTGTTRDELKDAVADGIKHIVEVKISSSSWPNTEWGNFGGSYEFSTGYLRPTHINGVPITFDDIDFDNVTEIVPAQWDSTLDANGNDRQYKGEVARNGQLENGPCVELDGVNQSVSLGTDSLLGSDSFTLVFGISPNSRIDADVRLFGNKSGTGVAGALITCRENRIYFSVNDGEFGYTANDAMTAMQEHTLVIRGDRTANTLLIMVDGEEVDLVGDIDIDWSGMSTLDNENNYAIGAQYEGQTNNNFACRIWRFEYYNSALSDSDCEALTTNQKINTSPNRLIPFSEESGSVVHDAVTGDQYTLTNNPTWGDQDSFFHGESVGYSLYEHASDPDILVPLKSDGTALTITPPSGYTKTGDYPAGPYHNDTQATLKTFVTDSDSEAAIFYGASFDGTSDGKITCETNISSYPFTIKGEFQLKNTGTQYLAYVVEDNDEYIGLQAQTSSGIRVHRRSGASYLTTVSGLLNQNVWYEYELILHSETSFTFILDGEATRYDGEDSVSAPVATVDGLLLGTFRPTTVSSPNHNVKNVQVMQGTTIVNDMPLYKDSLDRSGNCFHGVENNLSGYLSNAAPSALNPTITGTETLDVTDGNKKLILLGQK